MKQIKLTQGKFALVDDEDYKELTKHKWYAHRNKSTFYPRRSLPYVDGIQQKQYLHVFLLGSSPNKEIDHRDGNGLNNQRNNLRMCTQSQNSMNRHGSHGKCKFKGVSWYEGPKRWRSQIAVGGKREYLGIFFCAVKAAKAYDKAAKEYFGEFANLNFEGD
jgi:hypothetical protein